MREQFRQDRLENRQLWCATQRQINELANEKRETDRRLAERIEQLAEESGEADKRCREANKRLVKRTDRYSCRTRRFAGIGLSVR